MAADTPDSANRPDASGPPAVVCTLTTKQLSQRGLEWGDLAALRFTGERIDRGAASTFPIELADQIDDLAERETSCCGSWLTTNAIRQGDIVRLELTTDNPDGLALIEAMVGVTELAE